MFRTYIQLVHKVIPPPPLVRDLLMVASSNHPTCTFVNRLGKSISHRCIHNIFGHREANHGPSDCCRHLHSDSLSDELWPELHAQRSQGLASECHQVRGAWRRLGRDNIGPPTMQLEPTSAKLSVVVANSMWVGGPLQTCSSDPHRTHIVYRHVVSPSRSGVMYYEGSRLGSLVSMDLHSTRITLVRKALV